MWYRNSDVGSVGTDKRWSFDGVTPSEGIFSGECPTCCAALSTTGNRPICYVGEHAILKACKVSYLLAGRGSLFNKIDF